MSLLVCGRGGRIFALTHLSLEVGGVGGVGGAVEGEGLEVLGGGRLVGVGVGVGVGLGYPDPDGVGVGAGGVVARVRQVLGRAGHEDAQHVGAGVVERRGHAGGAAAGDARVRLGVEAVVEGRAAARRRAEHRQVRRRRDRRLGERAPRAAERRLAP